ncbi:hypothetical protein [Calothrix sp. CCY 0018]|uniref:hypothetical protein n=1 Tax=Calothrix sp. CCY 0018 TaxID=3103864 RepID=UPI0039C5CE5F
MSNLVPHQPAAIEKVRESNGDVSKLTAVERKIVYLEMCRAYGLDPLSFPLDYIENKGKLKIYLNSIGAAQLRDRFGISTRIKSRELLEDMWVVTVEAQRGERTEEATGAASILDKYGKTSPDQKTNALKKAETQAKRRATLSICGFGWDDEESGKVLKAEFHDPPQDVLVRQPQLTPDNNYVWRTWKNPTDAIAWAKLQLPHLTEDQLLIEFNNLKPVNGKKAPVWFERVHQLKN